MPGFYRFIARKIAPSAVFVLLFASSALATGADLPIRGVVRAQTNSSISTNLSVPVKKIVRREGEAFKKGETLVEFDCARFVAEKKSLLAEKTIQELTYKNNLTLLSHNAIGEFDVEVSKAKVEKAQADIGQLDVRLRQCVLKAPFDGRVDELMVHLHETPKAGVPYVRILETNNFEIEFIVPSNWLQWLQSGAEFDFRIDETSKTYKGKVTRLGASVDPVSQTVKIRGAFTADSRGVFVGMSGSAHFNQPGS